ncbi:OLC1v1000941C2 [Oldenlandia corymbosa var. corymbosa]|nr:OLC1v1000941C2 [Oldenlandia corymbosa var. corymbosa]
MPQHGDVVVLENEAGQVFDAKFLGSKMGLSGGWRGFCVSNKLREGDAAVFHMIGATKFKVYIVRATTSGVAETPKHSLSRKKGKKREGGEVRENKYARQYEKSRGQKGKDSENDARKCGRATAFVGFQDFNIVINGRNVDINKPDVLFKYYQLCKAQNSFLHSGFLEPISPESAVSIISDTVRIADGIRSSGIFTPKNTFAVWDKALEGFEKLGLEVGFLRARVHKLANLAEQAEDSPPAKKLKEARVEYNLIAEEVEATTFEWYLKSEELNALDARLQKAKQEGKQLYCEMESLNGKIKEVESRFLKEARSPWWQRGGEVRERNDRGEHENSIAFADFQDFKIIFNGILFDFEIPDAISYLSAIDIISDTVEIATAIKSKEPLLITLLLYYASTSRIIDGRRVEMEREPYLSGKQGGAEALRQEANHQQQQHQTEVFEIENLSDMEDQMSVTSRPKSIRPFRSTKQGIQKGSQTAMKKPRQFKAAKHNSQVPSSVMDRAEQLRANLDAKYPSFAKLMRRSYVVHGFLLAFPTDFCREYMSQHDVVVVLENEAGKVFDVKFLGHKMVISGGWRGFCASNKLREGDAAVFHMIGATKFKVYRVRATSSGVAETPEHSLSKKKGKKRGGEVRQKEYARPYEKSGGQRGQFSNENDARKCGKATAFVGFQDFNIVINGCSVDINKPDVLFKYYQLCKAQNSYLHSGFLEPISPVSAVSIISDTVRIADGIRSSDISTPKNTFALWDKVLEGFEILGLEVGFLRARVHKLANLAKQAEYSPPAKKLKQARVEYNLKAEEVEATTFEWYLKSEELDALDAKIWEAKQEGKQLYCEMESLSGKIKKVESRFLKEAKSPW